MSRATRQEQSGGIGAHEVSANFERIGWAPVPNHEHDLGTDLLIRVRDDRLFEKDLLVGAQVKGGASYFDSDERSDDGEVIGWWYTEPNTKHFDDWVCHPLPHLIVLHDLEDRVSYWEHVTAERVSITGVGCKKTDLRAVPRREGLRFLRSC